MKIIYKKRQEGKTFDLLKQADSDEGYNLIICRSISEVKRLWNLIQEYKYKIPMPICYDDFIKGQYHRGLHISGIYIDDVDALLEYMSYCPIKCISLTKGDE